MRDRPYVGYMDAGNTAAMGEDPVEDIYEACGPVMSIPVPRFFNDATVCPPGLFTYFDALAQATAMLYGPYLRTPTASEDEGNGGLSGRPRVEADLVQGAVGLRDGAEGVERLSRPSRDRCMGGNTWRPNGDDSLSVGMPPPFEGVSAPYAGKSRPRFHPLDLYVMGLLPWQEVPPIRSFLPARLERSDRADSVCISFIAGVGPSMGTRIGGVALRKKEETAMGGTPAEIVPVLPMPHPDGRASSRPTAGAQPRLRDRPPVHPPAVGADHQADVRHRRRRHRPQLQRAGRPGPRS